MIPSYYECMEICAKNPAFYYTKHTVEGFEVVMFDYFMVEYNDFVEPYPGCYIDAFELRGLTFVNYDGIWEPFPALQKFFLVNQTPLTMYDRIKDFKIKSIYTKHDGSMITFIMLPNGNVVPKSKMSFTSPQAELAKEFLFKNPSYLAFAQICLRNHNFIPIFELIGSRNMIVVPYNEKISLRLLHVRERLTGNYVPEFLDTHGYSSTHFKKKYPGLWSAYYGAIYHERGFSGANAHSLIEGAIARRHNQNRDFLANNARGYQYRPYPANKSDLDILMDGMKEVTDMEGYVVSMEDPNRKDNTPLFVKVKSDWYMQQHRLITTNLAKEDEILAMVISAKYDEIFSSLNTHSPLVALGLSQVRGAVLKYINFVADNLMSLIIKYHLPPKHDPTRNSLRCKAFKELKSTKYFGIVMHHLADDTIPSIKVVYDELIALILKENYRMTQAREFLEKECNIKIWDHLPSGFRTLGGKEDVHKKDGE